MTQELHGEYVIEHNSTKVGNLIVSQSGIRTTFKAECVVATAQILRLTILVGEQYIPLGVMRPEGDKLHFEKRYSRNELQTKSITTIHGAKLISIDQPAPEPTPAPLPEATTRLESAPESIPKPTPAPEPAPTPTPEAEVRPEPTEPPIQDWETVRDLPDDKAIYTHTARITIENPVADADLEDIDPYPDTTPAITTSTDWVPCLAPSALFTDPTLAATSQNIQGAMIRERSDQTELAVPFGAGEPFPLMPIFCKGEATEFQGKTYLVFQIKDGKIVK